MAEAHPAGSIGVEPLITGLDFEALIGDKAFDNNWLRANDRSASGQDYDETFR
jgi:hypothetical protein